MTAAPAIKRVDLLEAFIERAEARAYLWAIGELGWQEAVDKLQHDAERHGLIKLHGQDQIQTIIAAAFEQFFDESN